jgi:hypothetical protein
VLVTQTKITDINIKLFCSLIGFLLIQTIAGSLIYYSGLSSPACVQVLKDSISVSYSDTRFIKKSRNYINISRNETLLDKTLRHSPTCLLYSQNPSVQTQSWLGKLKRHLVIIETDNCEKSAASLFNVDLYCITDQMIHERYSIRSCIVFRELGSLQNEFPISIYNNKVERRSDLQGVELTVTTLNYGRG